jgi:DNA-directed RNA polymerase specialized sigma24 family protein
LTKPPALASLSDAELAQRLGQIIEEVQRRLERKGKWPELEAAAQQARLPLDRLGPRPAKHIRSLNSRTTSSVLLEGQRNAVRAALLAGVAPTQVAKHFGLPLTTVRKVLEETA